MSQRTTVNKEDKPHSSQYSNINMEYLRENE